MTSIIFLFVGKAPEYHYVFLTKTNWMTSSGAQHGHTTVVEIIMMQVRQTADTAGCKMKGGYKKYWSWGYDFNGVKWQFSRRERGWELFRASFGVMKKWNKNSFGENWTSYKTPEMECSYVFFLRKNEWNLRPKGYSVCVSYIFLCSPCISVSITLEEIVSVKLHYNLLWTLRRRGCWDIVAILYWFLISSRNFITTTTEDLEIILWILKW